MKTLKKLAAILVAAVAIAVFIIGFFGIASRYGEITTPYVYSAENIMTDADLGSTAKIVFKGSAEETPDAAQMDLCRKIISKRLEYMAIADYAVDVDYEGGTLLVTLPLNSATQSDLSWILQTIGKTGVIYGVTGSEDSEMRLFENDAIKRIKVESEYFYYSYFYSFDLVLNREGKAALTQATTELLPEGDAPGGVISFWYNGESFASYSVKEVVKNGKLSVSSSITDATKITEIMMFADSGALPFELTYGGITESASTLGKDSIQQTGLALACGVGAVIILLVFCFGLSGLCSGIMTLGAAGFTMFFVTGFMTGRGIHGTLAALMAFALVLLLGVETALRDGQAMRERLKEHSVAKSVGDGYKSTLGRTLTLYVAAALVGILMILCGNSGVMAGLLKTLGMNASGILAFGTFGAVLLAGLLGLLIFNVLLNRLMVRSVAEMVKKPVYYGGGAREE